MKIMFLSNIPSPYRLDFFNELGKYLDLKVVFEAKRNYKLNEKWYKDEIKNFQAIFLKDGEIEERKINWKILKHINKNNQDLIVVTNYAYFTELIALLYIKLKRIPYCMEVDGGIIRNEKWLIKKFKSFLIKGARAYISPSKDTDRFLIHYGANKEKIYRYPFTSIKESDLLQKSLTIDEKIQIRKELGIKEEKVVISVGQFIHRKGYDILLKACESIDSNIGVYIIGGKPTDEYLRLKEQLNLTNVYFIDFKSKEEIKKYYKAADLFVLPTREDIWGLVINEAMAYGLPVITTNKCVAGLELIENIKNGYIVEVKNYIELANKIDYINNNKKSIEMMASNNLDKIKNYTIENMAKVHIEIFKKILKIQKEKIYE